MRRRHGDHTGVRSLVVTLQAYFRGTLSVLQWVLSRVLHGTRQVLQGYSTGTGPLSGPVPWARVDLLRAREPERPEVVLHGLHRIRFVRKTGTDFAYFESRYRLRSLVR
jgi:hypothetical protein